MPFTISVYAFNGRTKVLPNVVITDPDGNKLINYTAIIPVMIDAIKTLQTEIDQLKSNK
jgi:hypothetical protein